MTQAKGKAQASVARNTAVVGLWTLLSRILGATRDLVVAHLFGASWTADAFYIAQTIPNAFRRLVGEGAVAAVLVPTYASRLEKDGEEAARRYARALLGVWVLGLSIVVVAGVLAAPALVGLFAAGYHDKPEAYALTVSLTRWMFPYLGLVSVVGFLGGVANSHGRFGAPAASPVLFNIFIILGAVVPMTFLPSPVYGLAVGVLVGGAAQLMLMLGDGLRGRTAVLPTWRPNDADLPEAWRLMLPQLFGIAIYQINIIVLRAYASFLPEGSVTQYYNASRLQELALGLFAVALATATQPTFAKRHASGDRRVLTDLFHSSMMGVIVVNIGAAVGLIALGQPICIVLFGHGAFGADAVLLTAEVLAWLAVALVPVAIVRFVGQVFYAFKQAKKPVVAGFWSMLTNAVFGALFSKLFGVAGLGMGLALATTVQAFLLMRWMKPQLESWLVPSLIAGVAKCLFAALVMGAVLGLGAAWFPYSRSGAAPALALAVFVTFGGLVYLLLASALGVHEVRDLFARVLSRLRRRSGA